MPPNVRDSRRFRLFAANRRKCVNIGGKRGSKVEKVGSKSGRRVVANAVRVVCSGRFRSQLGLQLLCCMCSVRVCLGFYPRKQATSKQQQAATNTKAHTHVASTNAVYKKTHTPPIKYTQKWDATRNGPQGERSVANRALPLKNICM